MIQPVRLEWRRFSLPASRWTRLAAGALLGLTVGAGLALRNPPLLVLGLGIPLVAIGWGATRRPGLAAGTLLLVLFTRVSDLPWLDGLSVSLTQAVVALFLGVVLVDRLVRQRRRLAWDPLLGWMLVYAAAIGVSAVFSVDPRMSLANLAAYLRDVLIVWLVLSLVATAADLRLAVWSLVSAGSFLALVGLLEAQTGFDLGGLSTIAVQSGPNDLSVRLEGPVGLDSNVFAQLLVLVVPLALYLAWTERHAAARWTALAALGVAAVTVMWTFSRGGFVGLLVVLGGAAAAQRASRSRLAAIGLALVLVVLGAPHLYWGRLELTGGNVAEVATGHAPNLQAPRPTPAPTSMPTARSASALIASAVAVQHDPTPGPAVEPGRKRTDDSVFDRWSLIQVGLAMLRDYPLTGVGRGNYYYAYPRYAGRIDPNLPSLALGPHNMAVQIAADSGVVGLAAFCALIVATGLALRQARRHSATRQALLLEGIGLAIAGYLVTGMFLNDTVYDRYLWLLVGLVAAGRVVARAPDPTKTAR
jgi:hypothetical protein